MTIADPLARLGFKPADVSMAAIGHNHFDHTGQAPAPFFTAPSTLAPWLSGGATQELISGDHNVFGDGSVVMVALPGHTPRNHGLLVRLAQPGVILISGDALHSPSN